MHHIWETFQKDKLILCEQTSIKSQNKVNIAGNCLETLLTILLFMLNIQGVQKEAVTLFSDITSPTDKFVQHFI